MDERRDIEPSPQIRERVGNHSVDADAVAVVTHGKRLLAGLEDELRKFEQRDQQPDPPRSARSKIAKGAAPWRKGRSRQLGRPTCAR